VTYAKIPWGEGGGGGGTAGKNLIPHRCFMANKLANFPLLIYIICFTTRRNRLRACFAADSGIFCY